MKPNRQISILLGGSDAAGAETIRGAMDYARRQHNWKFHLEWASRASLAHMRQAKPDGILCASNTPEEVAQLRRLPCPVVLTVGDTPGGLPSVGVDDPAAGRAAAAYFRQRGYRNIAFCGTGIHAFSEDRLAGLLADLREHGLGDDLRFRYHDIFSPSPGRQIAQTFQRARRWIDSLPKPVGIFACIDILGNWLTGACEELGVRVPEDVAILGMNNFGPLCESATPPLSSIPLPSRRVGHAAAELLDELMSGKAPPREPIVLPPDPVVTRQSTDTFAVADDEVRSAVAFIRDHAFEAIGAAEVVAKAMICRRDLERRFRRTLGRTIGDEIRRIRLDHACELLRETDMPISEVATACGYANAARFCHTFRKDRSQTAGVYRAQFQKG